MDADSAFLASINEWSNRINNAIEYALDTTDETPLVIAVGLSPYLKLSFTNMVRSGINPKDIISVLEFSMNVLLTEITNNTISPATRSYLNMLLNNYNIYLDPVTFDITVNELLKLAHSLYISIDENNTITIDNDVIVFINGAKLSDVIPFSVVVW